MSCLTFYGGINEIGGNKILLEDDCASLLLDFGFPYKRYKAFYEEYMKPRSGAGLLDPLTMGLLPPLEGLYRQDFNTQELWRRFQGSPFHRRLEHVDGVLLSHAHLDHSGYVSFLRADIPVYSTAMTAFIAKAMQDSGKSDFDKQVCYFSPTVEELPTGWRQAALLSDKQPKQQRQFCIPDTDIADLSLEAGGFWARGFWQKTPKQRDINSCQLKSHGGCSIGLKCFPVDHSIPGACAWAIGTDTGWVVYSGDLRRHGKDANRTRQFIEEAAKLRPKAMIVEGTNVERTSNTSEEEVYENAFRAARNSDALVIADFSPRDVFRLMTFLQIAKDMERKLVITPKDAYLLKTVRLLDPRFPKLDEDRDVLIYQETTADRYPDTWLRNLFQDYHDKLVLARDVGSYQDQFVLCFSFFDLNELPSIRPRPGSLYLYSSSEPHDEEQEIDFRRLHGWLKHFGLRGFGLPVECGGQWQIPETEKGLHASGHACGPDLLDIVKEIRPQVVIPIHSESPEFYAENCVGAGVEVILPRLGETFEV